MGLLQLKLARVPGVVGIYGATKDQFPARMSFMQPDAAASFVVMAKELSLKVSDMFRTAEESLRAMQQKSGVQPPGFSAHNYGMAIDIDTDAALKVGGLTKGALDRLMERHGWFCHRKDGKRGMEDWHYNFFGVGDEAKPWVDACASSTNRAAGIESKIKRTFGDQLLLTPEEAQIALAKMKFYSGEIDGKFGGGSKQALMAFQRAWKLQPSGQLDARTERTLAYVSAEVAEVKPAVV